MTTRDSIIVKPVSALLFVVFMLPIACGPPRPPNTTPAKTTTTTTTATVTQRTVTRTSRVVEQPARYTGLPMHQMPRAIYRGDLAHMNKLLDGGLDINYGERIEQSFLCDAVRAGNPEALQLLLDRGADATIVRKKYNLLASLLAVPGKGTPAEMETLIDAGADPNFRQNRETVLEIAIQTAFKQKLVTSQVPPLAELLVKKGARVKIRDSEGVTTLMKAVAAGANLATVQFLLDNGANINAKTKSGHNVFSYGIGTCTVPVFRYLKQHGPPISKKLANKVHLMWAVAANGNANLEKIKYLHSQGADVNRTARGLDTPLECAVGSGNMEAVKFMLAHGADLKGLGYGKRQVVHFVRTPEMFELIDKAGADIYALDSSGDNVLMKAIHVRSWGLVAYLLDERKYDPLVRNKEEITTLMRTISSTNDFPRRWIDRFLALGVNINAQDNRGWTALHFAVMSRSFEKVEYLVKKGASLTLETKGGKTPLEMASGNHKRWGDNAAGVEEIEAFLVKHNK